MLFVYRRAHCSFSFTLIVHTIIDTRCVAEHCSSCTMIPKFIAAPPNALPLLITVQCVHTNQRQHTEDHSEHKRQHHAMLVVV